MCTRSGNLRHTKTVRTRTQTTASGHRAHPGDHVLERRRRLPTPGTAPASTPTTPRTPSTPRGCRCSCPYFARISSSAIRINAASTFSAVRALVCKNGIPNSVASFCTAGKHARARVHGVGHMWGHQPWRARARGCRQPQRAGEVHRDSVHLHLPPDTHAADTHAAPTKHTHARQKRGPPRCPAPAPGRPPWAP
jgi:hypothetical protein